MKLNTNVFDLWTFHKEEGETKYLLLHTSQEKADKWFNGGRFWQIPGEFLQDNEDIVDAIKRCLTSYNLDPKVLWTVEHIYTYFNPRRRAIEIMPVFAAEVIKTGDINLTWEHSDCGWYTDTECKERINYRGLLEGLEWTKKYITETKPLKEFQLK